MGILTFLEKVPRQKISIHVSSVQIFCMCTFEVCRVIPWIGPITFKVFNVILLNFSTM